MGGVLSLSIDQTREAKMKMTNQEIENLTDAQIEDMTQDEMLQIYGCSECGREAEEFFCLQI